LSCQELIYLDGASVGDVVEYPNISRSRHGIAIIVPSLYSSPFDRSQRISGHGAGDVDVPVEVAVHLPRR